MGDFYLEIQSVFSRSHCAQHKIKHTFQFSFMHSGIIVRNETVSVGDTAVNPHTRERGVFLYSRGGGYSWLLKTQSAKF